MKCVGCFWPLKGGQSRARHWSRILVNVRCLKQGPPVCDRRDSCPVSRSQVCEPLNESPLQGIK
eukprot:707010-Pyramimonas_sp.AAC.1